MRLTLRTLLAYLDDILPPSQAREIGAKVTDTPDASKLMQRIRDVLKRRRIGAPGLSGPGSGPDPNVVAEYLDNSLASQTVIELEKICLSSEMHLAEVAGCHSILTLVLSEPVEVPQDMRERIYALGMSTKPAPVRLPEKPASDEPLAHSEDILSQAPVAASASMKAQGLSGTMDVSEMVEGIPGYLRQTGQWKKYAWGAVVVSVLGFWGVSVYWDLLKNGHQVNGENTLAAQSAEAGVAAVPPKPVEAAAVAKPGETDDKGSTVIKAEPAPASTVASSTTPPSSPLTTNGSSGVPNNGSPVMPVPEAVSPPAEVAIAPAVPQADVPAEKPVAEVAVPPLTALYTSGDCVVLISSPMRSEWSVFPRRGIVHEGDVLAVPAPYSASFSLGEENGGDLGIEVRAISETRLTRIPPRGLSRIGFELHRGSLVLSRSQTSDKPFKVLIRAAGRDWQIELSHPGTICGVQVIPPQPSGLPGEMGVMPGGGGVLVASGMVTLGPLGDTGDEFRGGEGWVPWPRAGAPLKSESPSGIPDWLSPEGVVFTPAARQIARGFEKEFSLDLPVATTIPPVIDNKQAKVSELAVKTVSLIGLYPELVRGLRSEHEESRLAAINGLREWLPQDPEYPQLLQGPLQNFYRDEKLAAVNRLLWGYSAADARNAEVSQQLVAWLRDEDVSIRELAFYHVFRLTGKRYDYRPNLPPTQRLAAVLRWEEHLKRNGGLLVGD